MSQSTQESLEVPKNSHTAEEWQRKFFAMGAMCHYCHKPLLLSEATKDHRTPKCRGGSSRIWNIVPACLPCNQKKGWRTEAEFLKAYPVFSKDAQPRAARSKPNCVLAFEVSQNEPGLLKKVQAERDGRVSWCWRNPA